MRLMFRLLLLSFVLVVSVNAGSRETELSALKKAFPMHTAGAITDKSDPLVIECYTRYKSIVDRMKLDSLASDLSTMRKRLDSEIRHYERELDRTKEATNRDSFRQKVFTPSMRHAMSMNSSWFKQKLRPYLARLESFQRGR